MNTKAHITFLLLFTSLVSWSQVDSNIVFKGMTGKLNHPVSAIKKIKTLNNTRISGCVFGEFISYTLSNTDTVKSIYDGCVISVFKVEGITSTLIKFGDYHFSYSGIDSIVVKKGDHVKAGQTIGIINGSTNNYELDILLLFKTNQIDIVKWLKRFDNMTY